MTGESTRTGERPCREAAEAVGARGRYGFLVGGRVVLTAIGVVLALALRQTATDEAIRDARLLTDLEATSVVGPYLNDQALVPGPARDALDRIVRQRVLGTRVVRVKPYQVINDASRRAWLTSLPVLRGGLLLL